MFLNQLNKMEKKAFLQLAHHIANSDDEFSIEEQFVISGYCKEMSILDTGYNKEQFNLNKTLEIFETKKSQRIALLELISLVYADNKVHENEDELLKQIVTFFKIENGLLASYTSWSKSILNLIQQANEIINAE